MPTRRPVTSWACLLMAFGAGCTTLKEVREWLSEAGLSFSESALQLECTELVSRLYLARRKVQSPEGYYYYTYRLTAAGAKRAVHVSETLGHLSVPTTAIAMSRGYDP